MDDDDYYYRTYLSGSSVSSYRSSYTPTSGKGGLSVGQSILYGLITYVVVFGLLGATFDGSAEYVPLFLWGIISALFYFGTNKE